MRGRLTCWLFFIFIAHVIAFYKGQAQVYKSTVSHKTCLNDTALKIYYANSKEFDIQICPQGHYCHPQKLMCVNGTRIRDFSCPGPSGYYPNLGNDSKFFICVNGIAYDFLCANGTYDQEKRNCSTDNKDTQNFNCTGKFGASVAHLKDKRLYAVCKDETPISLNECKVDYYFDEEDQTCKRNKFICPGIGIVADFDNPQRYYVCEYADNRFSVTSGTCPKDTIYCPKKKGCSRAKKTEC